MRRTKEDSLGLCQKTLSHDFENWSFCIPYVPYVTTVERSKYACKEIYQETATNHQQYENSILSMLLKI